MIVIGSGGISASHSGNCTNLEEDVSSSQKNHARLQQISASLREYRCTLLANEAGDDFDDDDGDVLLEIYEGDDKMEALLRADDVFKNGCLAYLCGYVTWKLRLLIKCLMCYKALFNSPEDELHPLAMDFLKEVKIDHISLQQLV